MAAPTATIEIPIEAMRDGLRLVGRLERPIARKATEYAAIGLVSEMQIAAPVKTGHLKDNHTWQWLNQHVIRIGATPVYSAAVHARHPDKAGWALKAIVTQGNEQLRKGAEKAFKESRP